jgi:hypothetical protein
MRLKNYSYPKIIYLFVFIIGLIFGVNFFYGNQTIYFKHFIEEVVRNPYKVAYNIYDLEPAQDTISLYIKKKNYSKLSENRKYNLQNRYKKIFDHKENVKEVKGLFKYRNNTYKAKLKLFGGRQDHWGNPNKWSLRVKLSGKGVYNQTKQFNLVVPGARGYLFDYLLNKVVSDYKFISLDYKPVHLFVNGNDRGVFLFEDFHNKYLIEKNRRKDSMIFKFQNDGTVELKHPNEKTLTNNQKKFISLLENFPKNFSEMIDKEKMKVFLALNYLIENDHMMINNNLNFYYNPHSNKIEPTIREGWPIEIKNSIKLKCNLESIISFFRSSKRLGQNRWLSEYVNILIENEINFEEDFLSITYDLAIKYNEYVNSVEYKKYHKILNNETSVNHWVVDQGRVLADKFISEYLLYRKFQHIIESKDIEKDSISYSGIVNINETLFLNKNVFIEDGTIINLSKNSNLIISGSLNIMGTESNPVYISNVDYTNSSILVLNAKNNSVISHGKFHALSSLDYDNWSNTASLTFYNSNVEILNSTFINNRKGDDVLNIVNSNYYLIKNSNFKDIKSDAIDIDFSNGKIINSSFEKIGNDAIDFSGSHSTVSECVIFTTGDKAISAGEKSNIKVNNSIIESCIYGIVSKDLSFVDSYKNSFENNVFDFAVYKKKTEYGPGSLNDIGSRGAKKSMVEDGSLFSSDIDTIIIDSIYFLINK